VTSEELRLVSCPACGAGSTDKCWFRNDSDAGALRQRESIHDARVDKAWLYRAEHRI